MATETRYLDMITSLYRDKPRFMAWLQASLKAGTDSIDCAEELWQAFDINTAVGKQLDTLGVILGRSRRLSFSLAGGFGPAVLEDETYRMLLKAKIAWNFWDGTLLGLKDIWAAVFPNNDLLYFDKQDMTIDVVIAGMFSELERQLIMSGYILPKPEGVRMNIRIVENDGIPIFAYGYDTPFLSGYTAHWLYSPKRKVFFYDQEIEDENRGGYDSGYWA